ncbi:MAG: UvrD-helicase domain-containing protein [Desulfuromonas sp.]|nr:UvrD-helicase domain-containing protein [Desulfuromonas sp.]
MSDVVLSDAAARRIAVDPSRSCIVRAPAGSGKTELLIQRLLALLGQVERPDAILAITFTRKAAAEMRQRVIEALKSAQQPLADDAAPHAVITHGLATAVLQRNEQLDWHLLDHPDQLQIQTIDSFNASLVRRMPWLSRLGGLPQISDAPRELYRQAVKQLLHLQHRQPVLNQAVRQLLSHIDNRADRLESLLIHLLERRDQWLRHLLDDSARQRELLEQSLAALMNDELASLHRLFPQLVRDELMVLADFAARHCAKTDKPLCRLQGPLPFPAACSTQMECWRGLADLLLTSQGDWRKRCDKNCGFPAEKKSPFPEMKQRMKELLSLLSEQDSCDFAAVAGLPSPSYSSGQWQTLQALVTVLPHAVAQLWLVFRQQGQVDFTEIALKARQSLVDSGNPTEQLLMLDRQIDHILVDEFQDTSWLQFDLLQTLISGWSGEGQNSLFVVGDPMQSIYRFREAEVGLFLQAGQHGIGDMVLEPLQLQANFRSQQGVVDWVNRWFPHILPQREDPGNGAVSYSQAQPVQPPLATAAVRVFARSSVAQDVEAQQVCDLIQQIQEQDVTQTIAPTIAVLVRSRPHLQQILAAFKQAGIVYQAQDVDVLAKRTVVADLVALTRALLHGGDHLSWLTVLRAPWCGLTLADLQLFTRDNSTPVQQMLADSQRLQQMSEDGRQRLLVVQAIVDQARQRRGRCSLRQLIEECWHQLQGPHCYGDGGQGGSVLSDAEQFFALLERLDFGGDLRSFELLEQQLAQLFAAADTAADGQVQVMTIHKSKGLEFDHVILPGLGRRPRGEDKTLLRWLEHAEHGLLLAPITPEGEKSDPIYELLGRIEKQKNDHEVSRLIYVAVTRAKRHLYLLGHAEFDKEEQPKPAAGSLLATLWPAVADDFEVLSKDDAATVDEVKSVPLFRLADLKEVGAAHLDDDVVGQRPVFDAPVLATHIGTVVHRWLDYLSRYGIEAWQRLPLPEREKRIAGELRGLGVVEAVLPDAVRRVSDLLTTTVASERGRWILAGHPQAQSEYPLTGMIDGEKVRIVIDRTFVADGQRWIVDYKTASPASGQLLDDFYRQQQEYYRSQLDGYARFLKVMDDGIPCRAALYFPACDGWCEVKLGMEQNGS